MKIVTPFQLLKYLFGLKGFEKGMSEWSGGYFIFDATERSYINSKYPRLSSSFSDVDRNYP